MTETEPARAAVLTEAAGLITGDRNKTYGSPTENFSNTAALWNVQIGHKLKTPLTAADVAQLMVQLKMARMIAQPKRDNYVDAAGYLGCGWECEEAAMDAALEELAEASQEQLVHPVGRQVRYFQEPEPYDWVYRWDGEEVTFVPSEEEGRQASSYRNIEALQRAWRDRPLKELTIDQVPEWAR